MYTVVAAVSVARVTIHVSAVVRIANAAVAALHGAHDNGTDGVSAGASGRRVNSPFIQNVSEQVCCFLKNKVHSGLFWCLLQKHFAQMFT